MISNLMLFLFTVLFQLVIATTDCDPGWFGSRCQYKCHCFNTCDQQGGCVGGSSCAPGWFGPLCQYQDLATLNTSPTLPPDLTDGNDSTCIEVQTFTKTWDIPYGFTWIRIITKQKASLPGLVLNLKNVSTSSAITHADVKVINVTDTIYDVLCDMQIVTKQVEIVFLSKISICSVHISGGRNVALKGETWQTNDYSEIMNGTNTTLDASKAVDGNTNANFTFKSCTHTSTDNGKETWSVRFFTERNVSRYIIYNRDTFPERLSMFTLISYSQDDTVLFSYVDKGSTVKSIYTITSWPFSVAHVNITSSANILTLCEVEIYGDIICKEPNFGLECANTCNCNDPTETCFVATGGCRSGCAAGYHGEGCLQSCDQTHYGSNCINDCSKNCTKAECNSTSGDCFSCNPGLQGRLCDKACNATYYGQGCSKRCSTNCTDLLCNNVDGSCISCINGTHGDLCEKGCDKNFYGPGCIYECSSKCRDSSCNSTTGHCYSCIAGLHGHFCDKMCPNYTYGDSCSKTCSRHCDGDGTCDVTNGTCVYGCRSGFQGETCDLEYIQDKSGDTPPIAAIVAPIVAVILIAVITIIGFVFWRKRRLNKNQKSNGGDLAGNELSTLAEYSGGESSRHNGKDKEKPTVVVNAYKNDDVDLDKRYINVTTLNDFMESQTRHYFVEEFKKIPAPSNVTTNVGQNESNKNKNKYKNICTYDHSRVHLEVNASKNEGDYINASYVEGYNNEEKFIASQGPNEVIINDFVRMLWEQKVDKVVMLTNLIEEGKEKCVRYWPIEGTATFGDIKVKLAATHVFAEYTIRKLELRKKNEVGHHFTQFHFTSWPDKGVPLTPWGLVDFEQRVALGGTSRPIVVHCSAGVGRTGTFIALRNVMREAEDTGRINCFQTVAKLRQDRVLMVQTAEQYEFLHKAAQVAIVCMRTTVSSNDILTRLNYLEEMTISKVSNMEKEFQTVSRLSEEFNKNESNKTSKDAESNVYQNNNTSTKDDKNRSFLVIPSKLYGAVLSCESNSFNHHINAVLVPSFTSRENQILTQLPMPNTVTDFWRLVAQYNVKLVVAFQIKSDDQDETIGEYLPQSTTTPVVCGPYEIHTGPVKSESLWDVQNITVKANIKAMDFQPLNVTNETHVTHIASKSTDLNPKNLLKLLKHTRSNNVQAQGRVLYMCRNGAEYSGLACVLSLLLDRMDHDQSLTVPLVVGAIKCIRPQVIPSLDQYRCLYQVLQRYSELNTPYSNYETPLIPTHQNIWTQQEKSVAENVYENS